jgi:hypothetical protein
MIALTAAAACGSGSRDQTSENAAATAGTGAAASPAGDSGHAAMPGGAQGTGAMHQDTLAPRVEAHLQRLQTNDPDSLRALVPANRDVVNALIADCEQMMREMKMEPPRKWRNAVQDLRRDLDRMASMTGAQLRQLAPEHRKRIEGMLAMRRDMMRM